MSDLLRTTIRLNVKMQNIVGQLRGLGGLPCQYHELSRSQKLFLLHGIIIVLIISFFPAATEDQIEPEELADLGPRDLSYWVASFFSDVKVLQQNVSLRAVWEGGQRMSD